MTVDGERGRRGELGQVIGRNNGKDRKWNVIQGKEIWEGGGKTDKNKGRKR